MGTRIPGRRALVAGLSALACLSAAAELRAEGAPPSTQASYEANLTLFELLLDGSQLSDGFVAYRDGNDLLLPLGELARLLSLAISVDPVTGSATGFVLKEDRGFGLHVGQSLARLSDREVGFESRRARVIGDDIYVSSRLLERWLPLDFDINLGQLRLTVKPREKLPLQARLERERAAQALEGRRGQRLDTSGYTRMTADYGMLGVPFIDQTLGADARFGANSSQYKATYTAFLTADVLGLEGAAFVSASRDKRTPDWRLTLGRKDPDANLLGPLRASSYQFGNVQLAGVANVMSGSGSGSGLMVSNRSLQQPTSFDRQSLRGDLPPGWDVTLYYNDALIGLQAARADGRYAFDDLPLSFGRNEFLLVFNGPLGQMRTERRSFQLDQKAVRPGEFLYDLAHHVADAGGQRSLARFDVGLPGALVASTALVQLPRPVDGSLTQLQERNYATLGLRHYGEEAILTSEFVKGPEGHGLAELGLKTRLGSYSVDLLHTQVQEGFDSDAFPTGAAAIRRRDKLRLQGALQPLGASRLPLVLDLQRDTLVSGATASSVGGRVSATVAGTSLTQSVAWRNAAGSRTLTGDLQISRRVLNMGLSGLVGFSMKPQRRIDTLALSADRNLGDAYRLTGGIVHNTAGNHTLVSAGLSRNFGPYALALSSSYSNKREVAVGVQLFMALGRDPRTGKWVTDGVPMAGSGAVSVRAFVDRNGNRVRDAGEELVANAGVMIDGGGRAPVRTQADGTAFIARLPAGRYADLALDPSTLEDPQWKPATAGVRVLPRPGLTHVVEFPVVSTTDIDGTVWLVDGARRRGIGDAWVELVDEKGAIVMRTRSSSDGFYVLPQALPGRYRVRVSPAQLADLRIISSAEREVEVTVEGDFINGQDLELRRGRR